MSCRIISVHEPDHTDNLWKAHYDLMAELRLRDDSDLKFDTWEEFKSGMLSHHQHNPELDYALILRDDQAVGWCQFFVRNPGTDAQLPLGPFELLPEQINAELVRTLARWFLEHLETCDAEFLYNMLFVKECADMVASWGGRQFSRGQHFVLHRKDIAQSLVDKWLKEIPAANPELRLEFFDGVPEELLDEYGERLEEALRDMPEENDSGMPVRFDRESYIGQQKWRRENNRRDIVAFLFDRDNNLVADSDLVINLKQPKTVDQLMTMVSRDYRGRGLAKWLKAAMIRRLEEVAPRFEKISTLMREVNEPIQHINEQLGFVLNRTAREFKLPRTALKDWLTTHPD